LLIHLTKGKHGSFVLHNGWKTKIIVVATKKNKSERERKKNNASEKTKRFKHSQNNYTTKPNSKKIFFYTGFIMALKEFFLFDKKEIDHTGLYGLLKKYEYLIDLYLIEQRCLPN